MRLSRGVFFILAFLLSWPGTSLSQQEKGNFSYVVLLKDFDFAVGSEWVYLRIDSLVHIKSRGNEASVSTETVTVEIVEKKKNNLGQTITWLVRDFGARTDTLFVVASEDSVKVLTSLNPPLSILAGFVMPLTLGKEWAGPYPQPMDTFKVVNRDTVRVLAGEFSNAYLINRDFWLPNHSRKDKFWLVPGIGLVKTHRWELRTTGLQGETISWELLSYNIKK